MSKNCDHKNFVIEQDVQRLSDMQGGPITAYAFVGHVSCYDCGLKFKPFRVRLAPEVIVAPTVADLINSASMVNVRDLPPKNQQRH